MLLESEELVNSVLEDLDGSALTEPEKVMLRFVDRVNHNSHQIEASDLAAVREHGWTDEQIYYAITVCALFNFYNRWIDATGVHPLSDQAHREGGKRSAATGYVRK